MQRIPTVTIFLVFCCKIYFAQSIPFLPLSFIEEYKNFYEGRKKMLISTKSFVGPGDNAATS